MTPFPASCMFDRHLQWNGMSTMSLYFNRNSDLSSTHVVFRICRDNTPLNLTALGFAILSVQSRTLAED